MIQRRGFLQGIVGSPEHKAVQPHKNQEFQQLLQSAMKGHS